MVIPRRLEDEEDDVEEQAEIEDSEKPYVVLIDDDPNVHEMVKRTLNKANINLIGATDGERGLQIIRERMPQLILLDVYMSGRDGWSILREVKSDPELQAIPVAMVTQLSEEKFAESLGAEGYFTKPIDRSTFIPEIHRLLGTKKVMDKTSSWSTMTKTPESFCNACSPTRASRRRPPKMEWLA